jgi:mono/diheme cytochrome c family protein
MTPFHPHPGRRFAGLAVALAMAGCGAARAADLSVCIDRANPAAAMDQRVAAAVAAAQGETLQVHAFDGSGDDEGYALKNFAKLLAHACQLVMGFPFDTSNPFTPAGLFATAPYARVGFVLVTPPASQATDLASLPAGSSVAVTYMAAPNLYFATHPNVQADVRTSDDATLHAVVEGHAQAAMVWQPTLASYRIGHPDAGTLAQHALNEPHAQWSVVALYGAGGKATAAAFEAGVTQLDAAGRLGALLAPFAAAPRAIEVASAAAPEPVPDAVPALYTADQADAGQHVFMIRCAMCHGRDLSGMAGPALKGKNFASVKAAFHVGDVFKIVSQNMPASNPGTLQHDDYVNVMAYLLQQNGYPAGGTKLVFDQALNSQVPLLYHGN